MQDRCPRFGGGEIGPYVMRGSAVVDADIGQRAGEQGTKLLDKSDNVAVVGDVRPSLDAFRPCAPPGDRLGDKLIEDEVWDAERRAERNEMRNVCPSRRATVKTYRFICDDRAQ